MRYLIIVSLLFSCAMLWYLDHGPSLLLWTVAFVHLGTLAMSQRAPLRTADPPAAGRASFLALLPFGLALGVLLGYWSAR